jgi:hypothetical protein
LSPAGQPKLLVARSGDCVPPLAAQREKHKAPKCGTRLCKTKCVSRAMCARSGARRGVRLAHCMRSQVLDEDTSLHLEHRDGRRGGCLLLLRRLQRMSIVDQVRKIFWDALNVRTRTTTNFHGVKQQMRSQGQLQIVMASNKGPFFITLRTSRLQSNPHPLPPPGEL